CKLGRQRRSGAQLAAPGRAARRLGRPLLVGGLSQAAGRARQAGVLDLGRRAPGRRRPRARPHRKLHVDRSRAGARRHRVPSGGRRPDRAAQRAERRGDGVAMATLSPAPSSLGLWSPQLAPWFSTDVSLPAADDSLVVHLTGLTSDWLPPGRGILSLFVATTPRPAGVAALRK